MSRSTAAPASEPKHCCGVAANGRIGRARRSRVATFGANSSAVASAASSDAWSCRNAVRAVGMLQSDAGWFGSLVSERAGDRRPQAAAAGNRPPARLPSMLAWLRSGPASCFRVHMFWTLSKGGRQFRRLGAGGTDRAQICLPQRPWRDPGSSRRPRERRWGRCQFSPARRISRAKIRSRFTCMGQRHLAQFVEQQRSQGPGILRL